ncbi:uncharacterized protein LOC118408028 [Branchiostoma floridae]|uniref:Uncharacterized protein LOC118408028 n=1 Tax=Branchiostoma floridae TaxID=7739 RepID=A0A9J7HVY5_BRAFL|nr:uncharacterized protein LOC118408028 [Branchiostoma floridae]
MNLLGTAFTKIVQHFVHIPADWAYPPLPLVPTMPCCEDCRATGAQPCQGDLFLCQECADKRFPPTNKETSASRESNDVIINDMLCFVVNKMDVLPTDVITKLCIETYSDDEVEAAKKLVFDLCKPNERYKKSRGTNRSATTMADILRVLHSMDPPSIPTFVSATLHLPPVSFEHVDITAYLQQLQVMRQEMRDIRDMSIDSAMIHAELASLRREIVDLRSRADPAPAAKKATYAEAASDPVKSVPQVSRVPSHAEPRRVEVHDGEATVPKSLHVDVRHKPVQKEPIRHSPRSSRRGSESGGPSEPGSDGFRLCQKRKPRPKAVVGTARTTKLSAVGVRPPEVFVTRLEPETQPEDIEQYLNSTLSQKCMISCKRLQTKYDSYASFRVSVESVVLPEVLAPSTWPCGVLVRRYHDTRHSGPPRS